MATRESKGEIQAVIVLDLGLQKQASPESLAVRDDPAKRWWGGGGGG